MSFGLNGSKAAALEKNDRDNNTAVVMVPGDMFHSATYTKDVEMIYIKHILHDWDDASCTDLARLLPGTVLGSRWK